jgi:hypothetical protein
MVVISPLIRRPMIHRPSNRHPMIHRLTILRL